MEKIHLTLNKIITFIFRLRHGFKDSSETVNIIDKLATAKTALIFMPENVEEFGAALKALERLRKLRTSWKITIFTKAEMVSFIHERLKVKVVPFLKRDINLFGLPKTEIKKHFQGSSFDLILDFKPTFDIFTLTLMQLSNTQIRVCMDTPDKSPFYNIAIRVNPAETLVNKYSVMIKYINMIADSNRVQTPAEKLK